MNTEDNNPRPLKRQRCDAILSEEDGSDTTNFSPIPAANLLLSLPSLLLHPPTHHQHHLSLQLSTEALKRLLSFSDIHGDMECRAWTALAELGILQGLQEPGVGIEIEKAIAKALLLAQKHPSLRFYKPHLSLLSAKMAYEYQDNFKYAVHTVRRLLSSLVPSDPPHLLYTAHLALITYSENESSTRLLDAIQNLQETALRNGHSNIALLAQVIRLRVLLREGLWQQVTSALKEVEAAFQSNEAASSNFEEPAAELCLRLHLLIMGVVYYTYAGETTPAASRLTRLHEMLDKGSLNKLGEAGVVEFPLSKNRPLYVQMTHPRVLYLLAFLVSSASKRNPVGRKPKRKVFASEGLAITERELRKEMCFPLWTSHSDAEDAYVRVHKIKADMLGELAANSICRSEFDDAENYLNTMIAHTRNTCLFPLYAARISLHHAHLAHSLGQTERALDCYRVAAHLSRPRRETEDPYKDYDESCMRTPTRKRTVSPTKKASPLRRTSLSPRKRSVSPTKKRTSCPSDADEDDQYPEDTWLYVSARVGELWLRIGLARQRSKNGDQSTKSANEELEALTAEGEAIAKECDGLGGTLRAVGEVLRACLAEEVLKAKGHLRVALDLTSMAQDNHLRALIIALISSHYLHTKPDHAETMLLTCEQLAAGLGAQPRPQKAGSLNNVASKPPLSTSDNINISRGRNAELDDSPTPKPRSKRKINEVDDSQDCASRTLKLSKSGEDVENSSPWGGDDVGNAQLRLWVGERFLELSRRAKNERRVKLQEDKVRKLQEAVNCIGSRKYVEGKIDIL